MQHRLKKPNTLVAVAVASGISAPALNIPMLLAEESEQYNLEEIIVTATKR